MSKVNFWHLQMFLPDGREGAPIDSIKMLTGSKPVIGISEWDHKQCANFKGIGDDAMKIGDIVLVREGQKVLALCRVISDLFQNKDLEVKYRNTNFRHVEVLKNYSSIEMPPFPQPQGTLKILRNQDSGTWQYIHKLYKEIKTNMTTETIKNILLNKKNIILQGAPGTGKTYSTAALALSIMGIDYNPNSHKDIMEKYKEMQKNKRIFFTTFHQSMDYEDFVEGLRPEEIKGNISYYVKDGIFLNVCKAASEGVVTESDNDVNIEEKINRYLQLTKGESNKRVVKNLKDKSEIDVWWGGATTFQVRSLKSPAADVTPVNIKLLIELATGRTSKEIVEIEKPEGHKRVDYMLSIIEAIKKENIDIQKKENNDVPYILIIDEINRGNISKIFGELITLLENDKREGGNHPLTAILPYSNEEFSVPSNLYIIGTMNTTDRSVGSIDYAIRRRFAFYTLKANKEAIESYYANINNDGVRQKAISLFDAINTVVTTYAPSDIDAEDLMIGHSYFMANSLENLKMKLEYEIIPLIREYEKDGILTINLGELKNKESEWSKIL